MSDTVCVTGASGFLGLELVRALCARGNANVRAFSRHPDPFLHQTGAEIILGDVLSPADLDRAFHGVSHVFHLAGTVSRSRAHSNELFHLHVQGTRRVLEAMKRKGCQRVVLASTSGTVAVSTTPEEKDEDSPYCEEIVRRWPYYHSKIYAERSVLHAVASGEIEAVILRPSLLLGPGDRRLSSTRDVRNILKGRYVLAPQGGISFVDVRDAAAAFVTAGFEGVNGRRYLLSGANMSTREFIDRVCVIGNKRPSLAPLPSGVSKRAQRILQRMRLSDLATTLEMSRYFWYVDASRARSEIGFAPRLPTQTLQDTVDWLADQSVR